jgi:hypothetical protein
MTAAPKRERVRPYGITATEGRARDSRGWWYRTTALTLTEHVQPLRNCEDCNGDGVIWGETVMDDDTECPHCEGDGAIEDGTPYEDERGCIELDRDNTEAVRWLDGTLIEELDDALDRERARADRLAQSLTVAAMLIEDLAGGNITLDTVELAKAWLEAVNEEQSR